MSQRLPFLFFSCSFMPLSADDLDFAVKERCLRLASLSRNRSAKAAVDSSFSRRPGTQSLEPSTVAGKLGFLTGRNHRRDLTLLWGRERTHEACDYRLLLHYSLILYSRCECVCDLSPLHWLLHARVLQEVLGRVSRCAVLPSCEYEHHQLTC